ncbi:hypothetical protein [Candidatus Spongiihabitans sp.]|uniref:hypothetical protein n=1 Tax=Candidatus Spongiihabitans sp. TaxID=3101308 RepID=UPI003C7E7BED
MTTELFDGNDDLYQNWLAAHTDGFVINTSRREARRGTYMVLHRARCKNINESPWPHGGFTERSYIKVCALTVDELRAWARTNGRVDGSFSSERCFCKSI